jgi:hypothetical protein
VENWLERRDKQGKDANVSEKISSSSLSSLLSPVHIYERSLSSSSSSSSPFDLVVVSGIWDRAAGENALSSSIHLLKRLLAFFYLFYFPLLRVWVHRRPFAYYSGTSICNRWIASSSSSSFAVLLGRASAPLCVYRDCGAENEWGETRDENMRNDPDMIGRMADLPSHLPPPQRVCRLNNIDRKWVRAFSCWVTSALSQRVRSIINKSQRNNQKWNESFFWI